MHYNCKFYVGQQNLALMQVASSMLLLRTQHFLTLTLQIIAFCYALQTPLHFSHNTNNGVYSMGGALHMIVPYTCKQSLLPLYYMP